MKPIIYATILILLLPSALGLAIAPAQHHFYYGDGEHDGRIRVINNHQESTSVSISVTGELAPFIKPDQEEFSITSQDSGWFVTFALSEPETLEPGAHEGTLKFQVASDQSGMVGVALAMESIVYLHVPYPGTHAEADLIFAPQEAGDVVFSIPILNTGSQDIRSATVHMEVLQGEEVVGVLNSLPVTISSSKQKVIHLNWLPEEGGDFLAMARVSFDDKELQLTQQFTIGGEEKGFNISNLVIYSVLVVALIALIVYQYRRSKTLLRRVKK